MGKELNVPIRALKGECYARKGISCEECSILIDTVKPAEDGNGVILRLYESLGFRKVYTYRYLKQGT